MPPGQKPRIPDSVWASFTVKVDKISTGKDAFMGGFKTSIWSLRRNLLAFVSYIP